MKQVWLLTDEELDILIEILREHTELTLEATLSTTSKERRLQIREDIALLEKRRIAILGR